MTDKQIKIGISTNVSEFRNVTSQIQDLTNNLRELVKVANEAGSAFGKIGGIGGGGGGLFGGIRQGGGGTGSPVSSNLSTQGGNSGIASPISNMSNLFKAATLNSKESLTAMTDLWATSVQKQTNYIQQLERELDGLNGRYKALSNVGAEMADKFAATGKGDLGLMNTAGEMRQEAAQAVAQAEANLSKQKEQLASMGGAPPGAQKPSFWNREIGGGMNLNTRDAASYGAAGYALGGAPGGIATGLAGLFGYGGAATVGLAIARGAIGAFDFVNNKPKEYAKQEAAYDIFETTQPLVQQSQTAKKWGKLAWDIRNDATTRLRLQTMPKNIREFSEDIDRDLQVEIENQTVGMTEGARSEYTRKMAGWISETGQSTAPTEMAQKVAELRLSKQQKMADYLIQGINSAPVTYEQEQALGWAQSSYQNVLQLNRAARSNRAVEWGRGTIYDSGELVGMSQQLARAGGSRYIGEGNAAYVLGLQSGGLSNAAQIFGAAGQIGDPRAFMKVLSQASSTHGAAGLVDPEAASIIGSTIAEEMTTNGVFLKQALQGTLAATNAMGGGIFNANTMARGMGFARAINSGQTSNMQSALNAILATNYSPDLYQQLLLQGLSPSEEMNIMRQGQIPGQMFTGGKHDVDIRKGVYDYVNKRNVSSFYGFHTGLGAGKDVDSLITEIRDKDDFYGVIQSRLAGGATVEGLAKKLGLAGALSRGKTGTGEIKVMQAYEAFEIAKAQLAAVEGGSLGAVSDPKYRALKRAADHQVKETQGKLKTLWKEHAGAFDVLSPEQEEAVKNIPGFAKFGSASQAASDAASALQKLATSLRDMDRGSRVASQGAAKAPVTTHTEHHGTSKKK